MKQPWIAKNTEVKMWYVGGNNIKVLDDIDEKELVKPIYYSCDWDLAGLQIYTRKATKKLEPGFYKCSKYRVYVHSNGRYVFTLN